MNLDYQEGRRRTSWFFGYNAAWWLFEWPPGERRNASMLLLVAALAVTFVVGSGLFECRVQPSRGSLA